MKLPVTISLHFSKHDEKSKNRKIKDEGRGEKLRKPTESYGNAIWTGINQLEKK